MRERERERERERSFLRKAERAVRPGRRTDVRRRVANVEGSICILIFTIYKDFPFRESYGRPAYNYVMKESTRDSQVHSVVEVLKQGVEATRRIKCEIALIGSRADQTSQAQKSLELLLKDQQ